jgi:predicted regulator of Ras-like GTPase activity (Roadblock/LC7/MglB family)
MSFFNWFRKKSQSTEAETEAFGAEEPSPELISAAQTTSGSERHESAPDIASFEAQSSAPPVMPLSAPAPPKPPARVTAGPSSTGHLFVPIGAFYDKLPPHFVAPEKPDLTRLIEIAEEDVVIDQEAQEATVPLSILSLSCPDIFVRPVADSDEIPITFLLNRQLSAAVVEPPSQPAAQPLENGMQTRESGSAEVPISTSTEAAEKTVESLEINPQPTETAPLADPSQTEPVERRPAPTVRATTATGKINLPDMTLPPDEFDSLKESAAGTPASPAPLGGVEFSRPADAAEREIRLRLEPILANFPLGLGQPSIRDLSDTRAEIVLPLDVVQSQLPQGRVVVSAAMFCRALPDDLKPYFDGIEPTAEIPIPLREIFERLPPELIKLREDQEIDYPEATIQTPFSEQTKEDAKRLGRGEPTPPEPGPMTDEEDAPVLHEAATPVSTVSPTDLRADDGKREVSSSPSPTASEIPFEADSAKLHAIFMTDETLDLAKTISMVGELPGLRACVLNTADGLKLAGNLDNPSQEQAISALMPELFQLAQAKLASMHLGGLETITLYCGRDQLSTFVQEKFCLTVLHDNRPFKPGVREKVQAVISELVALTHKNRPL